MLVSGYALERVDRRIFNPSLLLNRVFCARPLGRPVSYLVRTMNFSKALMANRAIAVLIDDSPVQWT